jgi:hypothetical protein
MNSFGGCFIWLWLHPFAKQSSLVFLCDEKNNHVSKGRKKKSYPCGNGFIKELCIEKD